MQRATRSNIATPGAPNTVRADKTAPASRTRLTLRPGENGTKKLQAKYGPRLLAVRYRYDPVGQRRLKTVELEEELPWSAPRARNAPAADTPVHIRIAFDELELRQAVKAAGARWDKDRKLWLLPHRLVAGLDLDARIVATGSI